MSDKGDLKLTLNTIIQKSHRALEAAKIHLKNGDYDFASSKAYYAVFYMMEAGLITKKLSFSKHSAVISAFNQYFIKQGIFPKEFSKKIGNLFKERQIGDYEYELAIAQEEAREDIKNANEIVKAIEEYLRDKVR
ncbi:HEPN domain-containing protein [candidate division WOR-3 bacterium]|nr:HEPN domain-containing protein [candidate division WOR-3 bacterium]